MRSVPPAVAGGFDKTMQGNAHILLTAVKRALMLIIVAIDDYQGIHVDKRRVRLVADEAPP